MILSKQRLSGVAVLLFWGAIGCDQTDGSEKTECTPDDQQSCDCADETQGSQECREDGTWGDCDCSGKDTGEGDADADGDGDGDSDGDADGDTDGDADGDTDGDSDGDTDGDTDGDSDSDIDTEIDTDPDHDRLAVLWYSDDPMVAERIALMYTHNAKTANWFDLVTLIVWGPSQELLVKNDEIQTSVLQMMDDGVSVIADIECAEAYDLVDELEGLDIPVYGLGESFTTMIKSGWKTLSF